MHVEITCYLTLIVPIINHEDDVILYHSIVYYSIVVKGTIQVIIAKPR